MHSIKFVAVLVFLGLLVSLCPAAGQEAPKPPPQAPSPEKVEDLTYEDVTLRLILQDLAKRAGTTVSFAKEVSSSILDERLSYWTKSTARSLAVMLCGEYDLALEVKDKAWNIVNAIPELSITEEKKAKGRYSVLISRTEVVAAITTVAKTTQIEFRVIGEKRKSETTWYKPKHPVLRTRYATADHVLRELARQAHMSVEFVPAEGKNADRYELEWPK